MNLLNSSQTNWKYILVIAILAFFIGGGILGYCWWVGKKEIKIPEVKVPGEVTEKEVEVPEAKPGVTVPEEKELEEGRIKDLISNVEIIARENELDKNKTDIFIKDLNTDKEEFFVTLSGIDRDYFNAEFRNGHLYINKSWSELWQYSFPNDEGNILLAPKIKGMNIFELPFMVSPDENFVVVICPKEEEELGLPVYDYLIFINLTTKEQEEFSSRDLATNDIISFQEKMTGAYVSLNPELEKWSNNSEDLWGVIYAVTSADPPMPSYNSLFKIDVKNWRIEKFTIPTALKDIALNPEKEVILYDGKFNGGLALYLYDLHLGKKEVIISYSEEVFHKYFGGKYPYLAYSYPGFVGGTEARFLEPIWIDNNTFSYHDFETREEVIEKIE